MGQHNSAVLIAGNVKATGIRAQARKRTMRVTASQLLMCVAPGKARPILASLRAASYGRRKASKSVHGRETVG